MTGCMLDTDISTSSNAVSQGMTLVTNNLRHFTHVPGLKSEVWSER